MGLKVDIGCGINKHPGYIGIDTIDHGQEYIRDINKGLPFADNTVSEINMSHYLEHINGEDVPFLFSEIYRVCHNGATILIRLPHGNSVYADLPLHLSKWNEETFKQFSNSNCLGLTLDKKYNWTFGIKNIERFDWELKCEYLIVKHNVICDVKTSKVSIIIVAWNGLEYTKKCIKSFERWTKNRDIKIILIDSASNDGTEEWATKYDINNLQKEESNINFQYVRSNENIGWIKGINEGLKYVPLDTEFVIFSNNDIQVTENGWIDRLLGHFKENVGAVGPVSNYVMGRQSTQFNHEKIWEEPTGFLIGFFMCIRKSVIDEIGELDEDFIGENGRASSDDLDYSIRIVDAGYELLIARDVFVHHAGSKSLIPKFGIDGYKELIDEGDKALRVKWGDNRVNSIFNHPVKIMIAVPERSDYIHRKFCFPFAQMIKPYGVSIVDCPRGLIHDSRNLLVRYAKQLESDFIFFMDDDHIPKPNLLIKLMSHMELDNRNNEGCDFVTSLAFNRRPPYEPTIYNWIFDPESGNVSGKSSVNLIRKGLQRIDATGMHGTLIRMSVFDKIPEPWFELTKWGEDIDFCLKAYDADIPLYCDTDLINIHIGENNEVDEETFFKYMEEHKNDGGINSNVNGNGEIMKGTLIEVYGEKRSIMKMM